MDTGVIARTLIAVGVTLLLFGVLLLAASRFAGIGRLPGDFVLGGGGVTVFIPVLAMLILSIILTILLNLLFRLFR
ncbi:MAG: DUF2905 family protein [Dehalococcoidia bacterium]